MFAARVFHRATGVAATGFGNLATAGRAAVLAALPLQAAGRHGDGNDGKHNKNRAFHVRRFLFVRIGSLNSAGIASLLKIEIGGRFVIVQKIDKTRVFPNKRSLENPCFPTRIAV
jgi:hypothetical protein